MPGEEIGFYLRSGVMTTPGRYQPLFGDLPRGVAALVKVAQGLVIHEFLTEQYGVTLTDERRATVHTRPADRNARAHHGRGQPPADRGAGAGRPAGR